MIQNARAKNRDYSCVWIEDRLSWPVGARITKSYRWDADLLAPKQHQFFLIDFRQSINCLAADGRFFGRWHTLGGLITNRAAH